MREKKLTVKINRPVSEVFKFTTNPANTHTWVPSIKEEKTNEWPVKLGTIYTNTSDGEKWNEYEVTEFEKDKTFTFSQRNFPYHVRYTFTPTEDGGCDLEYFEWVDEGELDEPFTQDILDGLRKILEK